MKKYVMVVAKKGKFLFRTEPLEYGAFKEMIKEVLPPLSLLPEISIIFDVEVVRMWTTYDIKITCDNCVDVLDNLAKEE